MKNILLLFTFVCCTLFCTQRSNAQCYVRLEDASGFNTDPYQSALQDAAARLCAVFDTTGFDGQFKVYDFGFYLHQESTTGGYPEPFAQKIQQVQALSPYYLLFGKQTDKTGVYTKFWVDLKLPDTGEFGCISEKDRSNLKFRCELILINSHRNNQSEMSQYSKSEIVVIDSLIKDAINIATCCKQSGNNCSFTYCYSEDEIKSMLEQRGFRKISINILGTAPAVKNTSQVQNKLTSNITIVDSAMLEININDETDNIAEDLSELSGFMSFNFKCYITKNENICGGSYFNTVNEDFSNASGYKGSLWFHIFDGANEDYLYIKWIEYDVNKSDLFGLEILFHQGEYFPVVQPYEILTPPPPERLYTLDQDGFIMSVYPCKSPKCPGWTPQTELFLGAIPKIKTSSQEIISMNDPVVDDKMAYGYYTQLILDINMPVNMSPEEIFILESHGGANCHLGNNPTCRLYCTNYPFFFNYSLTKINQFYTDGNIQGKHFFGKHIFAWDSSSDCGKMDYWCHYLSPAYQAKDHANPLPCQYQYLNMETERLSPYFRFESMNISYNMKDFGNFMWGGAMKRLGFSLEDALYWANWNENFKDSDADKRAISTGYNTIPN